MVPLAMFLLAGCSPVAEGRKEQCANSVDDDGDGRTDCEDPVCWTDAVCQGSDAGQYGFCAKCGQHCVKPQDCFANGWDDAPLPQCIGTMCTALLEGIELRVELDTSAWNGTGQPVKTWSTRFVLKTALDLTPVDCATLKALATSTAGTDADQIERSNRFNFLAYDVTPISQFASPLTQPFLHVGTGSDFIIWTELWSGPRDSNTKLPTGIRWGTGCTETGPAVEPVKTEQTWPSTGVPTSTSRTIKLVMPPP